MDLGHDGLPNRIGGVEPAFRQLRRGVIAGPEAADVVRRHADEGTVVVILRGTGLADHIHIAHVGTTAGAGFADDDLPQ